MQQIEKVRGQLREHPVVAVVLVMLAAALSLQVAAMLALLAIGALAWPKIEKARSPEARAESAVDAMRRQTIRVVQTVSASMADAKLLEQALERENFQVRSWDSRAEKATLARHDDEARRCIERKLHHETLALKLGIELERQREAVSNMRPRVDAMRREAAKAQQSGDLLAVRARRAAAKRTIVLTASGLETDAGEAAFRKMAEDVARQEAEADAMAELTRDDAAGDEHAAAWDKVERGAAVEADLEELKRKVGMRRKALGV